MAKKILLIAILVLMGSPVFAEATEQVELRASVSYYNEAFPSEDQIPIASISIRTLLSDGETFDFESKTLFAKGKIIKRSNIDDETNYEIVLNVLSKIINDREKDWGNPSIILNKGHSASMGIVDAGFGRTDPRIRSLRISVALK